MAGMQQNVLCTVCHQDSTHNKDIACVHIICKKCLGRLVVQDIQGSLMFHCPNCQGNKPLFQCEKCDVKKSVCYCHECNCFLCELCTKIHMEWDEYKMHKSGLLLFDNVGRDEIITGIYYSNSAMLVDRFCETCVCDDQDCTAHYYHQYDVVTDCFQQQKGAIIKSLQPTKFVSGAITDVKSQLDHLTSRVEQTKDKVHRIRYLLEGREQRKTYTYVETNAGVSGDMFSETVDDVLRRQVRKLKENKIADVTKCLMFEIKHVETISNLGYPHHLTVAENGAIIVAENEANSVSVFQNRRKFKAFGRSGPSERNLNSPCGVAVLGSNTILVTDEHCVKKFKMDGTFIESVGNSVSKGSGRLNFDTPWAVAVDKKGGRIYVADTGNHRIQVLNFDLSFHNSFGNYGTKPKQFNWPSEITINSHQQVIVADCYNHRVQVLTSEGEFLYEIKQCSPGVAELKYPISVCVDQKDVIYTLEQDRNRICLFDSAGNFMKYFVPEGSKDVNYRYGLAVDGKGFIYVSDSSNKQIQIFTQF